MKDYQLIASPVNYEYEIKAVKRQYENQKGIIHGFQKDVIQNAQGARITNSYKDWSCKIDLVNTDKGSFLLVTDYGTTGLTGNNFSVEEIDKLSNNGVAIPPKEKLARISSRYNSGGNDFGGGLFGIGKTFYNIVSKDLKYIFESNSINKDEGYRCNLNDKNRIMNRALENDEAKEFVRDHTGLSFITHTGTRFIIYNPIDEMVEAVKDGSLVKFIQETWWRLFSYFNKDTGIYVNNVKISLPEQYETKNLKKIVEKELINTEYSRIRKIGFFINDNLDDDLSGFYYYRKGMKIGQLVIECIPKSLEGKYFGYVEVDDDWEKDLADIEEGTHYDVNSTKKRHSCYRILKNTTNEFIKQQLIEWNYISNNDNNDSKLRQVFDEIKNELEELFSDKGLEDFGVGEKKLDYVLRLSSVNYPNESKTVYQNESISFAYTLKTTSNKDRLFKINIETYCDDKRTTVLVSDTITSSKNNPYLGNYSLKISDINSVKFSMNNLVISIIPYDSSKKTIKRLTYYYLMESPKRDKNDYLLTLYYKSMPRKGSRRVNFGENISEIMYRIENNTLVESKVNIRISLHEYNNNSKEIYTHYRQQVMIKPYEEVFVSIPYIVFDEEKISHQILKGKIILRAEVSAAERLGEYTKGQKLSRYDYLIMLNQNDKIGPFDSFKIVPIDGDKDKRRSWMNHTNREILINVKHPQYQESSTKGYLKEYAGELVTRHFLLHYLYEGKSSIISLNQKEYDEADIIDVINRLNDKIEETWWDRWR